MIEKYFNLSANHTTIRTEFVAGLTTFVSMAYILFVNPAF
jgi:adenine/guanine/hypoxanthine permease